MSPSVKQQHAWMLTFVPGLSTNLVYPLLISWHLYVGFSFKLSWKCFVNVVARRTLGTARCRTVYSVIYFPLKQYEFPRISNEYAKLSVCFPSASYYTLLLFSLPFLPLKVNCSDYSFDLKGQAATCFRFITRAIRERELFSESCPARQFHRSVQLCVVIFNSSGFTVTSLSSVVASVH